MTLNVAGNHFLEKLWRMLVRISVMVRANEKTEKRSTGAPWAA
jgi:hypothetical protein